MDKFDPTAYSIVIQKQSLDGHDYFVGRILEFPDVEVFEEANDTAYTALIGIIETLKIAADRNHKVLPPPMARQADGDDEYSGRVTLRLTKTLHRKAAHLARSEDVSLNQMLVAIVAEAVGEKLATPSKPLIVRHLITSQMALSTADVGTLPVIVMGAITNDSRSRHEVVYNG